MFKPKYQINNELLANIKRISSLITQLNSQNINRLVYARLERLAREVSTHASTSIEGNPLPLTEVKKILKNQPENIRVSEQEILNYNQALKQVNDLLKANKIHFDVDFACRIHGVVMKNLLPEFKIGRLRQEPVLVNDPRIGKTVYLPPDYKDVKRLMENLIEFIKLEKGKIDPLILAGIFHKEFVIIHPFIDGNGRTGRLLTKVLLASMGLNTFNLFSFENYYNQNVTRYFEMVGVRGNYYEILERIDFTDWLVYFCGGIIDELLRVGKELEKAKSKRVVILQPWHRQILAYVKQHDYITDKIYRSLTVRARPTRHLDFRKLIELGLITMKGKGRAAYYQAA